MFLDILVPLDIVLPSMIGAFPTVLILARYVVFPGEIGMLSPDVAVEVLFLGATAWTAWDGALVISNMIVFVFADCAKVLALVMVDS